ncbi:hypothetical protein [Mangrovactinospora gilvigrisea]|nr:hypothetical protein [Mangrovactinospora gilvigrisea]
MLLMIYAKCIDGQEDEMNKRIERGLGEETQDMEIEVETGG